MFLMGVPPLGPSPPGYGSGWVALGPAEPFCKEMTGPEESTEASPARTQTEEADQPTPYREELTSQRPVKSKPSEMEGHRSAEQIAPLVPNEATSSAVGPHGVLAGPGSACEA